MDGFSDVLYLERYGAQTFWRRSRDDRPLRPICHGGWVCGDDGHSERTGVAQFLRDGLETAGSGHDCALRRATPSAWNNGRSLRALINDEFSELTRDEILARLEQANIANAEMRSMQAFLEHPQLAARERWREVDSPLGSLPALLPPATMSGVEAAMEAIPALGQHTETILAEIGYEPSRDRPELRGADVI